ncbi:MAG: PAS domain-containing protein [Ignavibacteriaceae bacterium]|nr:PAS domain-containing protein [Ignavibacteriaceae bacterium]
MLKYLNLNELLQKEYSEEGSAAAGLTDTSPLVLVDSSCKIIYGNLSFKNQFRLEEGDNFVALKTEPNIVFTVLAFAESQYENLRFDLNVKRPGGNTFEGNYYADISRIKIEKQEYFSLYFTSLEVNHKLEDQVNNLHFALEYGKIPVMILSDSGKVSYCSKSFEKILSKNIDEVYNINVTEVMSEYLSNEDLIKFQEAIVEARTWSRSITCMEEWGTPSYRDLQLSPVKRESTDNVNFILTASDITHYVLKNLIIKRSEERLKLLINNISDHLLIIKYKRGGYLFETANDNFCQTFNVDRFAAHNKNIVSVLQPKLFQKLTEVFNQFESKPQFYFECENKENELRHFGVKVTFIDDKPDNDRYYIISFKDITDQMLYQQQLKRAFEKENHLNRLKTSFIENMSHEIRTPFNAIMGYSEIIDECLYSEDYQSIQEISHSVKDVLQRILNLFNNIVDVSQAESQDLEIKKSRADVNSVIRNIYKKKHSEAEAKHILLNLEFNSPDLILDTDEVKLEKIITALLDNAIKYTDCGGVTISTKKHETETIIIVSDTGSGMDAKVISRLLEPFGQEEEGYTRNFQGAGLGLTIAYRFTKALGGNFDINSEKGLGTTIILSFPG